MLRDVDNSDLEKSTVTLETITGHLFEDCDLTPNGLADSVTVGFWVDKKVMVIPIHQVAWYTINFNEEKENK